MTIPLQILTALSQARIVMKELGLYSLYMVECLLFHVAFVVACITSFSLNQRKGRLKEELTKQEKE